MDTIKFYVLAILGGIGSFIANLFGGWTSDLQTLLCFMAVDFIMGLMLAIFFKNSNKSDTGTLNRTSAWRGLCKKGITLLMVLVAYRLDITLGLNYIKTAVIIAFIAVELISIIENAGLMGVPIPKVITSVIDVLKQRAGETDGNSTSTTNEK